MSDEPSNPLKREILHAIHRAASSTDPAPAVTKRCAACGGRGWRLDLDQQCESCNPLCCEEHYPSEAMSPAEQAEHVCPVCSEGGDGGHV